MDAGARSQMANVVAAALCLLTLVFLTSLFHGMPRPALAAVVIVEAITFPGLLIWRIGGDLFFASVGRFDDDLKAAMTASPPPSRRCCWTRAR